MSANVLYLCGGRSFRSEKPGRKIDGVVRCWRGLGFEVDFICGGDFGARRGVEAVYGAEAHHRKWYRRAAWLSPLLHSLSERRDVLHDAMLRETLTERVKNKRPDVVWERSSRLHSAGLVIAERIGVPYVLEWKDHLIPYPLSWRRSQAMRLEAEKNRRANWIVVESERLRNDLARENVDRSKIIVAHNAVDPSQFRPDEGERRRIRGRLGIQDDQVLVAYLGSYAFYHQTPLLPRAAEILRNRRGNAVRFLLVGSGKECHETRLLAERAGLLGSTIIMHPPVPEDQAPPMLAAADIAVLPGSTDIICPIKVQEYMAAGLPAVLPDYDCNREVISDDVTGALFTPGDEISLADRIEALAFDRDARLMIGRAAREEVLQRFTWEATWGAALRQVFERAGLKTP